MFQRPPYSTLPVFLLRLLHLNVGLVVYGLAIALMVRGSAVGLGPWDVFHQGLSLITPLSFGQGMILAGLVVMLFAALVAKVKIGIGTVLNMLLIGVWTDAFLKLLPAPQGLAASLPYFGAGLLVLGVATGLYLTAGLGAGPRDGFVIGLARMTRLSVRAARTLVEVLVLTSGWLMGGSVGVGTLVIALAVGPLMQFSMRLFRPLEQRYDAADARARAVAVTARGAGAGRG